jgi:hypothetical protein
MGRFLAVWLAAVVGLLALVAGLNVAVDPYGILGAPRVTGVNADKVAGADWPRLSKPYLVEAAKPTTLLLGSSVIDVGMNPESAAWPDADRPVFNFAIDGGGPAVQLAALRHAFARTAPKLVLIGLAFEDAMQFPGGATQAAAGIDPEWTFTPRLRVADDGQPNPGYRQATLADLAFATISLNALRDSVSTLLRQRDPLDTHQTRFGFNSGGKFMRWARNEGQYGLVLAKDEEKAPQLVRWARRPALEVAPVGEMVRFALAHGARVIVYFVPAYADELELYRQIGIVGRVQAWKAAVAETVEQAAGDADVPVWDFAGFSPYTTEALPLPHETGRQMRWIWESIHFRPELGDLMIRRMVGGDGPADLGTQVTTATLPADDARFDAAQSAWVATHPADVARIAGVVDAAAHAVCRTGIAGCPAPAPQSTASR